MLFISTNVHLFEFLTIQILELNFLLNIIDNRMQLFLLYTHILPTRG